MVDLRRKRLELPPREVYWAFAPDPDDPARVPDPDAPDPATKIHWVGSNPHKRRMTEMAYMLMAGNDPEEEEREKEREAEKKEREERAKPRTEPDPWLELLLM